jgi:hypothetical protein
MESPALLSLPGFIDIASAHWRSSTGRIVSTAGFEHGLVVPPPALRKAILQAFVDFVYPQLPIVNVQDLVTEIDGAGDEGTGKVSLLLYQAVMFAGIAYVPHHRLLEYGFHTHHLARREYFRRAEACYDLSSKYDLCEPLVMIQALLFMTLWYDPGESAQEPRHWMRMAMTLSEQLGLHRQQTAQFPPHAPMLRLERRVAWYSYVRDRSIFLTNRRGTLIQPNELTLPPLTVHDFDLEPLPPSNSSCLSHDTKLFRSRKELKRMATLCVEQVNLIRLIDEAVILHERLEVEPNSVPGAQSLIACDNKLKLWWSKQLEDSSKELPYQSEHLSTHVQRAVAQFYHYTVLSALHRPLLRDPGSCGEGLSVTIAAIAATALEESTRQISQLAHQLASPNLALLLPASVVTALLSALIFQIMAIRSAGESVHSEDLVGFEHCLRLLALMQTRYPNAEDVFCFLESTIQSARYDPDLEATELGPLLGVFERIKFETLLSSTDAATDYIHAPPEFVEHDIESNEDWLALVTASTDATGTELDRWLDMQTCHDDSALHFDDIDLPLVEDISSFLDDFTSVRPVAV